MYVKCEPILEVTMQFILFFYNRSQGRNPEIEFNGNEFPFSFQLIVLIILFCRNMF